MCMCSSGQEVVPQQQSQSPSPFEQPATASMLKASPEKTTSPRGQYSEGCL